MLALLIVTAAATAAPAFAEDEDTVAMLKAVEARLLAARKLTIEADITARGAHTAQHSGRLELAERNRACARWQGLLRGAPVTLALASDGRALDLKAGALTRTEGVARESNRALIAGALRTGLLHNVLRLQVLQGPDHAGGGAQEWATAEAFRPTTYGLDGEMRGAASFGYDILLDGKDAGSVRIWLDAATGLPRRQQFTLRGPEGETTVTEDYRRFSLE